MCLIFVPLAVKSETLEEVGTYHVLLPSDRDDMVPERHMHMDVSEFQLFRFNCFFNHANSVVF